MFKSIVDKIPWKKWEGDARYQRLDILDRLQDGTFYNHLLYDFYTEYYPNGEYIPVKERRPSAPYNMCGLISKIASRKLFASRHAPRLIHKDQGVADKVAALLQQAEIPKKMVQLAYWGAVGSAAMTFKVVEQGSKTRLVANVWRAKYCVPTFDPACELINLAITYGVPGHELLVRGLDYDNEGRPIEGSRNYYFCMDLKPEVDITYYPIDVGAAEEVKQQFIPIENPDWTVEHPDLQLTQAHWFENLSGGIHPDGGATFQFAIPLQIELDYRLSQLGAGIGYNAAPQLVVIGDVRNESGKFARAASNTLHMEPDRKIEGGEGTGKGDAKLLEMTGNGIRTGLEYIKAIRKFALELSSSVPKDPEQLKGALAAKAMELLDEEKVDLIMELRTSYGESGYLPMTKKAAKVGIRCGHPFMAGVTEDQVDQLQLEWPRMYMPTPSEVMQLTQAMSLAAGGPASTNAQGVTSKGPELIELEDGKNYLATQIDLHFPSTAVVVPEDESVEQGDMPNNLPQVPLSGAEAPLSSGGNIANATPYPAEPKISGSMTVG